MRMRTALALVLALGALASGPGAALGQISDSGQAAEVQYPELAATVPSEETAENNDLPVTGFVAIPLLVTGAIMLLVGGVMHVRTRQD
jgi:hypothetical protein